MILKGENRQKGQLFQITQVFSSMEGDAGLTGEGAAMGGVGVTFFPKKLLQALGKKKKKVYAKYFIVHNEK